MTASTSSRREAPHPVTSKSFIHGYSIRPGLAIDPSGDLYVVFPNIDKVGPSGEELEEIEGECGCVTGMAVDPVSGDLYVDRGTSIKHFLPSGAPNDYFGSGGSGALVDGSGIAVSATGTVYVADDASNRVDVFDPATLPEATTEAPTAVTKTMSSLHGTVNPDGIEVASCEFEWGTEANPGVSGVYPHTAVCSPAPWSGRAPVTVSAELADLTGNTTYYYRLAASNANGTYYAAQVESFTTPPAVDDLSIGLAEDVTDNAAKLTGSLSPDGADTHYYFEYGTTIAYGSTSPTSPADAGSASESMHAETTLAGLTANTVYHYRLVGVNSSGPPTAGTPSSRRLGHRRSMKSPPKKSGR